MQTQTVSDPVVRLTETATREVQALMGKSENEGKMLRLYVEQGGCSGLRYSMTFDERRPGDLAETAQGVPVLVDAFSLQYLRGALVDFSDSLTAGGFKITNPNAHQSCGCGKSFST
jgi:iron-sulfur cluster assembly accessory protein